MISHKLCRGTIRHDVSSGQHDLLSANVEAIVTKFDNGKASDTGFVETAVVPDECVLSRSLECLNARTMLKEIDANPLCAWLYR